jgi:hypothetical protein
MHSYCVNRIRLPAPKCRTIIRDTVGNALVFRGTSNETVSGLRKNYEQVEVSPSWEDPEALDYFANDFEALWNNRMADVETYAVPEAVRLALIKFVDAEPQFPMPEGGRRILRQKTAMIWQFIVEAPFFENGAHACDATAMVESAWPHQSCVIDEVTSAWPDGRLLCDEVGMGKPLKLF